jgi:hypothetical protein
MLCPAPPHNSAFIALPSIHLRKLCANRPSDFKWPITGSTALHRLSLRSMLLLDLPETSTYLLTLFDMLATRPRVSLLTRSMKQHVTCPQSPYQSKFQKS